MLLDKRINNNVILQWITHGPSQTVTTWAGIDLSYPLTLQSVFCGLISRKDCAGDWQNSGACGTNILNQTCSSTCYLSYITCGIRYQHYILIIGI